MKKAIISLMSIAMLFISCNNPSSGSVDTTYVTTLAGSGLEGSADGTGTGASFYSPKGVTVDSSDNVYVARGLVFYIRDLNTAII